MMAVSPRVRRLILPCFAVAWVAAAGVFVGRPTPALAAFESDFEGRIFPELPGRYAKDHSLIRHTDGVYHLFYSRGNAGQGWNLPGSEIDIAHATSTDLIHWTIQPAVLNLGADNSWKERNVWAPHVLRVDMVIGGLQRAYLMAYTGVDSLRNQQIGIAVSNDLFTWTDLSIAQGAFRPNTQWALWNPADTWQNCRDPFVVKQGNQLWMLASVQTRPEFEGMGIRGAIALATSTNGLTWTDSGGPLLVHGDSSLLASAHLAQNPISNAWQLFYTRTVAPGGTYTLSSSFLDQGWTIGNAVQFDATAISSELQRIGAEDFYSRAVDYLTQDGLQSRAIRLDALTWTAQGPTLVPVNVFAAQWTLVSGNLGAQPTFRDRPGFRSGISSNTEGHFWVNTGEDFNGPYGSGCATCNVNQGLTGVLRSRSFIASGTAIRLRVGGTASAQAFVALVDSVSGAVRAEAHGLGTAVMTEREWNITALAGDRLYVEVRDLDPNGHVSVDRIVEIGDATGVPPAAPPVVAQGLLRVAPNPASGPLTLSYEIAQSSRVAVAIYGPSGRLVDELTLGTQSVGRHDVQWNGRTREGNPVPAGVYFVRMLLDGEVVPSMATRVTIIR
jgi:FlgD Ig-like domain/Glycosyl hydrolases family 32 N-terminal domain